MSGRSAHHHGVSGRDRIDLRLAQQKFGPVLELTGPLEFQMEAARVAADARLNVEFAGAAISRILVERQNELRELAARHMLEQHSPTSPSRHQPEPPTPGPGAPQNRNVDWPDRKGLPIDPEPGGDIER